MNKSRWMSSGVQGTDCDLDQQGTDTHVPKGRTPQLGPEVPFHDRPPPGQGRCCHRLAWTLWMPVPLHVPVH